MLVTAADTLQIRHIVDATVLQLQLNQSYIICYSSIYTPRPLQLRFSLIYLVITATLRLQIRYDYHYVIGRTKLQLQLCYIYDYVTATATVQLLSVYTTHAIIISSS